MMNKNDILQAAEAWDRHALEMEIMTAHNRKIGVDCTPDGRSPGELNAQKFRQVAKSLRLEARTGLHHCHCHLVPDDQCPKKRERNHD